MRFEDQILAMRARIESGELTPLRPAGWGLPTVGEAPDPAYRPAPTPDSALGSGRNQSSQGRLTARDFLRPV